MNRLMTTREHQRDLYVHVSFYSVLFLILGLALGTWMTNRVNHQQTLQNYPWTVICESGNEFSDPLLASANGQYDPSYMHSARCNAETSNGPRVTVITID